MSTATLTTYGRTKLAIAAAAVLIASSACSSVRGGRSNVPARTTSQETGSNTSLRSLPSMPKDSMVWIPPPARGWFTMGASPSDPDARADEKPAHRVRVHGFWMDRTEVTNAQFVRFVDETGYVTTAERPIDWNELRTQLPPGTPKPASDQLMPGSLVFEQPSPSSGETSVPLHDPSLWWRWTPGASWRHPEGPDSTLEGRESHPVVHVSFEDAMAYARWAGKRLPTEAEWEYAARGGLEGHVLPWDDSPGFDRSRGPMWRANLWQGEFPIRNVARDLDGDGHPKGDGFVTSSPVGTFPANAFGLFDMAGNVWEWCSDWYRADAYESTPELAESPSGPERGLDPAEPTVPKRVIRGGSFLCNEQYCSGYRVSARMKTSPDTGLMHLGFRCVSDRPAPASSPRR